MTRVQLGDPMAMLWRLRETRAHPSVTIAVREAIEGFYCMHCGGSEMRIALWPGYKLRTFCAACSPFVDLTANQQTSHL